MKTMLNGRQTEVSAARMLEILIAETRVRICRDLKRLPPSGEPKTADERMRWIELQDELQALDELAGESRQAVLS